MPNYKNPKPLKKRPASTTAEERMKRLEAHQECEILQFLETDRLKDQEDLRSGLTDSPPKSLDNFEVRKTGDDLILFIVEVSKSSVPTFLVKMAVAPDLTVSFSYRGLPLPGIQLCNVHSGNKLESFDQVDNVLMAMKNWMWTGCKGAGWVEAKKCLDRFVEEEEGETGGSDKSLKKAAFLREQLDILQKTGSNNPSLHRYSPAAFLFSYSVFASSRKAYEQLGPLRNRAFRVCRL